MIEKFSYEELKQIMKELGIKETGIRTFDIVSNEIEKLTNIQREKPQILSNDCRGKLYESVRSIVSITLNNVTKSRKGYWKSSYVVPKEDVDEFREMYQEIIEIIEKHNRKWDGDTD